MRFTIAFAVFSALVATSTLAAPVANTAPHDQDVFVRNDLSDLAVREIIGHIYARGVGGSVPKESPLDKPSQERSQYSQPTIHRDPPPRSPPRYVSSSPTPSEFNRAFPKIGDDKAKAETSKGATGTSRDDSGKWPEWNAPMPPEPKLPKASNGDPYYRLSSMSSASPSPGPSAGTSNQTRHAQNATDKQRAQLEKLLKDPQKPAYVPAAPKEKTLRAPREMMKNVQGSSAGAGSGEFHVYKASRRREFERLKLMDEESKKEADELEFEQKKREREEQAEAKTAKNRAKRQKKKDKAKGKAEEKKEGGANTSGDAPLKKRRLVNGQELVFKRRGADSDDEDDEDEGPGPSLPPTSILDAVDAIQVAPVIDTPRITIHEDD
ncbi:hypothetical protein EIP91_006129 [Steccherinum ochraceum]|uniref:DUF1168-domain-containing protein n=1 Tax=Steccherinum ochraceum TaxID=92696 RepID=A0A4R0RQ02_9APHY|nr:hypothetical protein EIP91_006129 [Steccherinum ochraceum]